MKRTIFSLIVCDATFGCAAGWAETDRGERHE
jgi:hypothetical protein